MFTGQCLIWGGGIAFFTNFKMKILKAYFCSEKQLICVFFFLRKNQRYFDIFNGFLQKLDKNLHICKCPLTDPKLILLSIVLYAKISNITVYDLYGFKSHSLEQGFLVPMNHPV